MKIKNETKFKAKLNKRFVKVSPEELAMFIKFHYSNQEMLNFLIQLANEDIITWDNFSKPVYETEEE